MRHLTKLIALSLIAAAPALAQDSEVGRGIFQRDCAVCHGMGAQGDGPMASILTIQPTDLTQLAKENEGVFPRQTSIARIDGRDPLVAHGSPMPIFGNYFDGKGQTIRGEDGVLIMTTQPIIDLITWLESLQLPEG